MTINLLSVFKTSFFRSWPGIFLFSLLCSFSSRAVTVTGSDIRVDYIGTGGPTDLTYRVTVVIYTQCDASGTISLYPNISIDVSSNSAGIQMKMPLSRVTLTGKDTLSPLCPGSSIRSSCFDVSAVSSWPGYIKNTYTGIISLPLRADDWVFYYWHQGNGRGTTSTNLCDSWVAHVGALCYFNNLVRHDNSSPRFTAEAFRYVNVGQHTSIYTGPVDPDLDSIVVRPTSSLGCVIVNGSQCPTCGLYSEIQYNAGYTINDPIASSVADPYTVDPSTGTTSFTSFFGGNFALAWKCEEYDRVTGQLMGYVIRDIALPFKSYTGGTFRIDSLPSNISGGVQAPPVSNTIVTCPSSTVQFDIGAQGPGATVFMTADRGTAAGSTFTITGNGTASPSGRFSWTPGANDIGEHVILVSATDSSCSNAQYPMAHTKFSTVLVKVIRGIDAGPDRNYCLLDGGEILLRTTSIPGIGYQWTDVTGGPAKYMTNAGTFAPSVAPQETSTWVVTASGLPATCKSRDTITVHVDLSAKLTVTPASPIILCEPAYLELDANAGGLPPYRNFPCELTGDLPATDLDSAETVPLGPGMQSGANPQSTPFGNLTTSRHQYLIRATDLRAAGMRSGTLTGMTLFASGNTSSIAYGSLKIHLKCTPLTALDANAFEPGTVPVYAGAGMVTIPASGRISFDFDAFYNWDTTQNLIVEICYTNKTGTTAILTDFYPSIYTSCVYTSNASGNSVCGGGVGSAGPNAVNELPRMSFRYHPAPEADFQYAWIRLTGDYVSDTAGKSPVIDAKTRTKYYVESRGRNGCLMRDSLDIFVSDRHFAVRPQDTTICAGDTAMLQALNGYSYEWYEGGFQYPGSLSCNTCDRPAAAPVQNTEYTVIIRDSLQCADTLHTRVGVLAASDVRILNSDTMIRYGESVQLEAEGADRFIWTPSSFLNNAGIPNPLATPTEDITYIVSGSSSLYCSSVDSVRIRIDYRDHIMVPSAFTPNGDGKNDVFRISNLTFQKVSEFRVFNRWGQEVYNADGAAKPGWDGSWKGNPQESGTYHYIIRVIYPDGYYEMYKGDLTLVK